MRNAICFILAFGLAFWTPSAHAQRHLPPLRMPSDEPGTSPTPQAPESHSPPSPVTVAPQVHNWWPNSYVVQVDGGVSQQTDSGTRRDMLKLMATSPVLDAKNIERVAIDYLKENLTTPTGVYAWALDDRSQIPAEASTWLRIDYTAWPHEVKGKTVIVGALAVHKGFKKGQYCFNADNIDDPSWRPIETFIVSNDAEQTSKNLKIAVARVLEKYANLRKHNENHSLPYAPPRAPVQ